ncbi:MAG: hypothetical protein EXR69_07550 [Myxococcales bacterium]|nr:hypothetical protein [Myxococcales bacterium]
MARKEKVDRIVGNDMDEAEQKMFLLKIEYEKFFSGIERIEPLRAREEIRRIMRDISLQTMTAATQRFKYQSLKARFQSLELYWTRNLVQIERGTHPKMKFRAAVNSSASAPAVPEALSAEQQAVLRQRSERSEREERAYKMVFEKYMEARATCGQSTELSFEAVREALHKQVRLIKSTYQTENVKFRILIEEGKAKVKAVPQ